MPLLAVVSRLRRLRLALFAWRLRLHARAVGARLTVEIDPTARLRGRVHLYVTAGTSTRLVMGPGAVLERGVLLHLGGGQVLLGPRVRIRMGCVLRVRGGTLQFHGDNILSYYSTIHCNEHVEIGRDSFSGEVITIADSNHVRPDEPDGSFLDNIVTAPVHIGERTWLAARSTITAGTRIGDDVTVAANSVVRGDLPDGVVAGGVPARILSPRGA